MEESKEQVKLAFDSGFYGGQEVWFMWENNPRSGIAINLHIMPPHYAIRVDWLDDKTPRSSIVEVSSVYPTKAALKNALFPEEVNP